MFRSHVAGGLSALFCVILLMAPQVCQGEVELLITGLSQPSRLVAPQGDSRLFVVQRNGLIRIFDQQGQEQGTFLDIHEQTTTSSERGLLGLAFPADFATSGRFYINYTDLAGDTRIARFVVSADDPNIADPASQEIILTVDQPYANHNGGHIEFGPDGMLYIGFGDGGAAGDPENRAQNDQELLGKMLRIDVNVPSGYDIPADNPFVGLDPLDEIWAKGLRNPWCYSFDPVTGHLYIADVGQGELEEIDVQVASSTGGENYGWRLMEGTECYNPSSDCNDGSLTLPVYEYTHGGSPFRCSISGGYVYRGSALPSLDGQYFFADYCSNQIWSMTWTEDGGLATVVDRTADLTPPGGFNSVASFGQDGLGELYILDLGAGRAYKIISTASDVPEVLEQPFLAQNTPNPFNPRTEIAYAVKSDESQVSLTIFDASGRLVRTLVQGTISSGDHLAVWDGTDGTGRRVGSGLYLYRLVVDGVAVSRKMVLLE